MCIVLCVCLVPLEVGRGQQISLELECVGARNPGRIATTLSHPSVTCKAFLRQGFCSVSSPSEAYQKIANELNSSSGRSQPWHFVLLHSSKPPLLFRDSLKAQ